MLNYVLHENIEKFITKRKFNADSLLEKNSTFRADLLGARESAKKFVTIKKLAHNLSLDLTQKTPHIFSAYLNRKRKKVSRAKIVLQFNCKLAGFNNPYVSTLALLQDILLTPSKNADSAGLYLLDFTCSKNRLTLAMKMGRSREVLKITFHTHLSRELLNLLLLNNEIPTIEDK